MEAEESLTCLNISRTRCHFNNPTLHVSESRKNSRITVKVGSLHRSLNKTLLGAHRHPDNCYPVSGFKEQSLARSGRFMATGLSGRPGRWDAGHHFRGRVAGGRAVARRAPAQLPSLRREADTHAFMDNSARTAPYIYNVI